MCDPFIGEIKLLPYYFSNVEGWILCNGQLLSIAQYTALYSIITTIYGGNGQTDFAVPNLIGRTTLHSGTGPGLTEKRLGKSSGLVNVSLTENQMPEHKHKISVSQKTDSDSSDPTNNLPHMLMGSGGRMNAYVANPDSLKYVPLNYQAFSTTGGGQSHYNMQPFLGMTYFIAHDGIYPERPS